MQCRWRSLDWLGDRRGVRAGWRSRLSWHCSCRAAPLVRYAWEAVEDRPQVCVAASVGAVRSAPRESIDAPTGVSQMPAGPTRGAWRAWALRWLVTGSVWPAGVDRGADVDRRPPVGHEAAECNLRACHGVSPRRACVWSEVGDVVWCRRCRGRDTVWNVLPPEEPGAGSDLAANCT
jgi:hypothetical protein